MAKQAIPEVYLRLKAMHPKMFAATEQLGEAVRAEGPLKERDVQLVQLAAAAAIRSEGAVHSHSRRALAAGATPEEVRHTLVALASTVGFPTVIAALSWAEDILARKRGAKRLKKTTG